MYTAIFENRLILALAADALVGSGHLTVDELEPTSIGQHTGMTMTMKLDGDIPALVYLSRCHHDEWVISVALWPRAGADSLAHRSWAGKDAGEAFIYGWLNRWMYKGKCFEIETFNDAVAYVSSSRKKRMMAIKTPATGLAADLMLLYSRPSAKTRKSLRRW